MAERRHTYCVDVAWEGAGAAGTASYAAYGRQHAIRAGDKPPIPGSADPGFRGDAARWNPEDLMVASLSGCHMLWYLGLCASAGVTVLAYEDRAEGVMIEESAGGSGRFVSVVLKPRIVISAGSDLAKAAALHADAHKKCFIANSVNFEVRCEPDISRG